MKACVYLNAAVTMDTMNTNSASCHHCCSTLIYTQTEDAKETKIEEEKIRFKGSRREG
jgi:hypothetical protein